MIIPDAAVSAVTVNCVFPSLSLVVVGLRINTRVFLLHNVGADDYLIMGAMVAALGFWAIVMLQVKAGLGRQITFQELPGFLYALWATIPVYNLALILTKLSITVQCYRVLRTPAMQKFLRAYFFVLVVYGLFAVLGTLFNCWPVAAYWGATQDIEGECMDRNALTFTISGVNIVTDIILVAVPLPMLWRLQIPRRQKMILCGVFGVGSVAVVTSVVRLHSLYMIGIAPQSEQSVQGVAIATMSAVEINIAIICASVPALKPLAVKIFPKMLLSDLYARSKRAYGGATGSRSRGGGRSRSRTATASSVRGKEIQVVVQQSIELESVPTRGLDDGMLDGKMSGGFGSESDLIAGGNGSAIWQVEVYSTRDGRKKASLNRRDDMV